jgi:hypothetical protein
MENAQGGPVKDNLGNASFLPQLPLARCTDLSGFHLRPKFLEPPLAR